MFISVNRCYQNPTLGKGGPILSVSKGLGSSEGPDSGSTRPLALSSVDGSPAGCMASELLVTVFGGSFVWLDVVFDGFPARHAKGDVILTSWDTL